MADLGNSDITFTPTAGRTRIIGRVRYVPGRMSLGDGSKLYPSGGIAVQPSKFGMYKHIDSIAQQTPGSRGIQWTYDRTNDRLKGYVLTKDTAFLVVEELQSFTAAGVCDHLSFTPAYIIAIHDNSGNLYDVIPSNKTPIANQAKLVHSTGVLTLGGVSAIGTVKVTYIPADDSGLWATGNISIEEPIVVAAGIISISAVAVQSVYDSTSGLIVTPIQDGQSPGANDFAISGDTDAGFTSLSFNAGEKNGKTMIVTYVKSAELDVSRFPYVQSANITLAAEAIDFLGTTGYKGIVIPTLGTRIVGREGTTNHSMRLGGPSLTPANGKARWEPHLNKFTANETVDVTTFRLPLLLQDPDLRAMSSSRELRVTESPSLSAVDVIVTGW